MSQVAFAPLYSNGHMVLMSEPTVLMIRPPAQTDAFLTAFRSATARTPHTLASPVLRIAPLAGPPLPKDGTLLLFTSVNGVAAWAAGSDLRDIPALCVGENTAQAAQALGFVAHSADGTGADLLKLALGHATPADRIYYISGEEAALDLAAALSAQGFQAQRLVLYAQRQVDLTGAARAALAQDSTIVPVFSPKTAACFQAQIADLALCDCRILCISAAAAAPFAGLKQPGLAPTVIADAPTRAAMITALDRMLGS